MLWLARLTAIALAFAAARCATAVDALDRLSAERLEAVHQAVARLQAARQPLPRAGPFGEYRANLHVHSAFSHDSRGQIDQIVAAAKAAGSQVLLFTEHPADRYDFFTDGHQGLRDGVLLVPGAEMKGLLVFPRQSVRGFEAGPVQEFSDLVRGRGGLTFLCHLEERLDWELRGLTGVEIYNTHADFKDELRLATAFRNPLWLVGAADRLQRYPQEAFSALQDYPADYLRRWDQLCQLVPHTGVSANDSHQNVGLVVRLVEGGRVRIEDALGQKLLELDARALAAVRPIPADATAGTVLFQLQLDPYENSLRHVGTHLLLGELSVAAVWDALQAGRAFVAFDWIADATGFDLAVHSGGQRHELGSRLPLAADLALHGRAPLPAHWKLIRSGTLLAESDGAEIQMHLTEPGNYRVELWLDVAGEPRPWILSNPFYVQAP